MNNYCIIDFFINIDDHIIDLYTLSRMLHKDCLLGNNNDIEEFILMCSANMIVEKTLTELIASINDVYGEGGVYFKTCYDAVKSERRRLRCEFKFNDPILYKAFYMTRSRTRKHILMMTDIAGSLAKMLQLTLALNAISKSTTVSFFVNVTKFF